MFLSFYTFIIIAIVQVTDSVDVNEYQRFEPLRNKKALQRLEHNVKQTAENKRDSEFSDEAKLFDNIQENCATECAFPANPVTVNNDDKKDEFLSELKEILKTLLKKLDSMENCKKEVGRTISSTFRPLPLKQEFSPDVLSLLNLEKGKRTENLSRRPRWGEWTGWSACSVSCGKGREIRWRHCIEECENAETEMEEKTCQLPACAPGKFFGIRL